MLSLVEEESDGESEGDGPEVPRGGGGDGLGVLEVVLEVVLALLPAVVMRGGRRIPPPRYAPTHGKTWHNSASSNHCIRLRPVVPHKGTIGIFCGRN